MNLWDSEGGAALLFVVKDKVCRKGEVDKQMRCEVGVSEN